MRFRLLPVALISTAVVLLVGAGALAVTGDGGKTGAGATPAPSSSALSGADAAPGASGTIDRNTLAGAIQLAQIRLRTLPDDDQTWAQLGSAYVQQARITADPSYYPKAQGALERSLKLVPDGNTAAMIGMGSLANARHEFAQAKEWGTKAKAIDPYNSGAYAVLNDALTQLGDYAGAEAAAQKMLDLQPGISSFSRASYVFEQRGQVEQARSSLNRALAESTDPADIAFCRYYLGELAFNNGDPKAALAQYALGLERSPTSESLLAGRAKSEAALGQDAAALADYATVVNRVPLPEYILEYAELLTSLGKDAEAKAQYAVLTSIQQLFAANGVVDDLTSAQVEADHGSPTVALEHARAEWVRRHSVLVADALAWALHRAGKDGEALKYAKQADRLGWRNATFAYHRGMIEKSLGDKAAAKKDLARALKINPYFSLSQAPSAVTALAALGGSK